jgi:hypothetical protein
MDFEILSEIASIETIANSTMKQTNRQEAAFAVCIDNKDYPASLELHKIYRVLKDDDAAKEGDLRVVDESGEDYLYPAENFIIIEVCADLRDSLLRAS